MFSEYSRDGADGFRPLPLPSKGEDLQPGRQYVLSTAARVVIADVYGLRNLPQVIECLQRRVAAQRQIVITTNLETGEIRKSETELPAQFATFRISGSNTKFVVDMALVHERAAAYAAVHDADAEEKRTIRVAKVPKAKKIPDLSILDL